jgi:lauroyl/myristoyl acyltransferase/2-polyprenyl-3-methyl-5-hydroxy-6-metoxy-1,4-benzoquinol methylase
VSTGSAPRPPGVFWRAARRMHRADFKYLLPALASLPIAVGHALAACRGWLNAVSGRDWRSMALGSRHVAKQSTLGYRALRPEATPAQVRRWRDRRFMVEARDEYEARLIAQQRVDELSCEAIPAAALEQLRNRKRGLVLLTPHFESFFLGVAFLARSGAKINLMTSAVTHDARVDAEIQDHFTAKYRGLERFLNGGKLVDLELGTRTFYRMLERAEVLVILGDAPVLPGGGVSMEVEFLGAKRLLSGGPLRLAQRTHSDLGGYLCRHLGGARYQLEIGPIAPAGDPGTTERVYEFFSAAICASPGSWWASDLLPSMTVVSGPANTAANPEAAHDVLLLTDSPLAGSGELELGLRQLKTHLTGAGSRAWHESAAAHKAPAEFLSRCTAPRLLVLLDPALIAGASLAAELGACVSEGTACAVASDQRTASGDWAISYTTLVDFERYLARRQSLARRAPWSGNTPSAYMIDVAAARVLSDAQPELAWSDLPRAFGERTVEASRAFVHSYAHYQQGARTEMLDLLPGTVQRLLDVGGGEGHFARAFIEQRGGEAWLVEPSDAADRAPPSPKLQVLKGRLEDADPQKIGLFDAVTFLDVLEHMAEPIAALLAARRLLRPGGVLLVSVPNVGHWSVVRDLALGRFDYLPVGVLCGTHLRFFTAASLDELLQEAGFAIVQQRRTTQPMPQEFSRFMAASAQAGLAWDRESLETETLHVLAALR